MAANINSLSLENVAHNLGAAELPASGMIANVSYTVMHDEIRIERTISFPEVINSRNWSMYVKHSKMSLIRIERKGNVISASCDGPGVSNDFSGSYSEMKSWLCGRHQSRWVRHLRLAFGYPEED